MKTLAVIALAAGAWWSAEGFALRPVGGERTARSRLSMTAKAMPPPLSLSQIASKLKFEVTDIDTGAYGLDSKDANFGIEIVKVKVPLKPSLGLSLEELSRGRDGRGMTLVAGMQPGSNAEKCGKIMAGDMICYLGREPDRMTRTEGLDLDETLTAVSMFAGTGASDITLVLKRLVRRAPLEVSFTLDDGAGKTSSKTVTMLAGSNLRKEMLQKGFPVYDPSTTRYDQPYVRGDCAGEGLCGTCLVQVLEGQEFLNKPDPLEASMLKKWGVVNWRLSCRCVVGPDNTPGAIKFKVTPQRPFNKK